MNVFLLLALAVGLILLMLRKHIPLGPAMLAGGIVLWLFRSLDFTMFAQAMLEMLQKTRTYDLIGALYLVMCLEIELRTSGTLSGMVTALHKLFSGNKMTMATMPMFLGLLPSLGGARFSAPIVEEAAKNLGLSPAHKAAINFWFRHPCEFCNPIISGMIMSCAIAQVPYARFVQHTWWMTIVCFVVGWLILLTPVKETTPAQDTSSEKASANYYDILLALSPIIITFFFVVYFNLLASVAMGIAVIILFPVLKLLGRYVSLKEVILDAIDKKMFINVLCILYFIQLLTDTGVLDELVAAFRAAPFPMPVIIAALSFTIGALTGMSQAHTAMVMPIVAAVAPGNLDLAATAMIFGVGGQMLTPTHMCLVVTLDYFNSDLFKTLKPILYIQVIVLTIYSVVAYFR